MSLAVVVVAYHHAEDLRGTLKPIASEFPVIVVDNSSSTAVEGVCREFGATYVDSGGNVGFAKAVNAGLALVPDDADILLLNPDAEISSAGLRQLHSRLRAVPRAAAVAPVLVGPGGEEQRVMWPYPTPARMWLEALGLHRLFHLPDEFAVGAVLLLRREALAQVGKFDERFFLYAEETDWQRRATENGWRSILVPDVTARHAGAGTSDDTLQREIRFHAGIETYQRKWFGTGGWSLYRAAAIFGALVRRAHPRRAARRAAAERLHIYLHGPLQLAGSCR